MFITAINATPFSERCMTLLNSAGPYAYCNVREDTSQQVDIDRLNKLYADSDGVIDDLENLCDKHGDKVNFS